MALHQLKQLSLVAMFASIHPSMAARRVGVDTVLALSQDENVAETYSSTKEKFQNLCDKWLIVEFSSSSHKGSQEDQEAFALDGPSGEWRNKILFVKKTADRCMKTYTAKCTEGIVEVVRTCPRKKPETENRWIFDWFNRDSTVKAGEMINMNYMKSDQFSIVDDRVRLEAGFVKWHVADKKPTYAPMVGKVGKLASPTTDALDWLNAMLGRMWPQLDSALWKIIDEQVNTMIQQELPDALKSLRISQFSLGGTPPTIGPIKVYSTRRGLKLHLSLDYSSNCEIQISGGPISLGIKSLSINGELIVQLSPLIGQVPVIGGFMMYFLSAPDIDMEFDGLAGVLEIPGIKGIVREAINNAISKLVVLPNVIGQPLASEQDGVDPALFLQPAPLGVMRVTAKSAAGLPARDHNLFSERSSDPYVEVSIADTQWHSSVVKGNCDPSWTTGNMHDFPVFDRQQNILIKVYDDDMVTADDLLGRVPKFTVQQALTVSNTPLKLTKHKGHVTGRHASASGTITMGFQWLDIVPFNLAAAAANGNAVVVHLRELLLPPSLGNDASISVKLGGITKDTTLKTNAEKAENAKAASNDQLLNQYIVETCKGRTKNENARLEKICAPLDEVVAQTASLTTIDLDSILYLFPAALDASAHMSISVANKKGQQIAYGKLPIRTVLDSEHFMYQGKFPLKSRYAEIGEAVAVNLGVSLYSLDAKA